MIQKYLFGLLFIGFFMTGFSACKSSQNATSEEENYVDDESFIDKEAVPEPQITVLINDRVEFQFVKRDDGWHGNIVEFQFDEQGNRVQNRYLTAIPKEGWDDFQNVVEFLNIYQLNNQSDIENREVGSLSDASRSYRITIRNNGEVKSLYYFNPEGEILQNWQSQSVATFGTYLATEFDYFEE